MNDSLMTRDFKDLAAGLNNYISEKGILNRNFYQAISNIRRGISENPTKDIFLNFVSTKYPQVMVELYKVNHENPKKLINDVYDLVVSPIDPLEVISQVKSITTSKQPRDLIKHLLGEFTQFSNRQSSDDIEINQHSGSSERYQTFMTVLSSYIKNNDLHEVLAWLHVVADHPSFNANKQVVMLSNGQINIPLTIKRMMHFANSISISDDDIFSIKNKETGAYLHKVGFSGAKRGTPDLLYIQGNSIKVGFASLSRDTNIEGTSFFRHVLDGAFLSAFMNIADFAGGTKTDICYENRRMVSEMSKLASQKLRCSLDFVPIGRRHKEQNDIDVVMSNTNQLLENLVKANLVTASQKEELLFRGRSMLRLNQSTRSLFFVRLNAFIEQKIQLGQVCIPVVTTSDIDLLLPENSGAINYLTTSPQPRIMKFMDMTASGHYTESNAENKMLKILSDGDENKLFRGLTRKAFIVKHGNIGGGLVVTPSAQKTLLDNFSFQTDTNDRKTEEYLSSAMLALMFTNNEYLWGSIKDEISDVMHFAGSSLLMGVSGGSQKTKYFHMGLFSEERNNIVDALTAFAESCNAALKHENDIYPIIESFFGEHASYVQNQITNGALLALTERFNTESFGFVEYGIKPSSSEDMQKMQHLSVMLDMVNCRQRTIQNTNKNQFKTNV